MKNLFISLVFFFVVSTITAQQKNEECAFIANELVTEMNGFIETTSTTSNGVMLVQVSIANYFDRALVIMKVNVPVREYKDVLMLRTWEVDHKVAQGETISCILAVNGESLTIFYSERFNRLFFMYKEFLND